jgi:hypothetical protein
MKSSMFLFAFNFLQSQLFEKAPWWDTQSLVVTTVIPWFFYVVALASATRITREKAELRLRGLHAAAMVDGGETGYSRWLKTALHALLMLPFQMIVNLVFVHIVLLIALAVKSFAYKGMPAPNGAITRQFVIVTANTASTSLAVNFALASFIVTVMGAAMIIGLWQRERVTAASSARSHHHDMSVDRVVSLARRACVLLAILHAMVFVFFSLVVDR